jgi:Domain of unknown function (DUF4129)
VARTLLAPLLAAALAAGAQAREPLQVIDDCVARLDSELDVGYAHIAARCPELTPALSASGFAPWLPADWQRPDNELSAAGLSELRAQLARESGAPSRAHPAPRSEQVAAVLAAVARIEDGGGRSWWQRLKDWLRGLITTHPQADDAWLRRWLADFKLSNAVTELIGWAALAAVVALAAGIVVNELRIAGVLRRRAERERPRAADGQRPKAATGLADIERAAPEEQPALLLELIALRLAAQQRLPPARALTARELERQARLPGESARARLAELVGVCECVRFSARQVSAASRADALQSGRVLLAALDGAPPALVVSDT